MEQQGTIILGIDPGIRITGYGIILCKGHRIEALDYGCIRPPPGAPLAKRYRVIFEAIEGLIGAHKPQVVAVEGQFLHKNSNSLMKLAMAKAMAILAAEKGQVPIFEYAPTVAKLAVVGSGGANKERVQRMIQVLLSLPAPPNPEDAADALAIAICHAHQLQVPLALSKGKLLS